MVDGGVVRRSVRRRTGPALAAMAVVLLAALLPACGGSDDDGGGSAAPPTSEQTTTTPVPTACTPARPAAATGISNPALQLQVGEFSRTYRLYVPPSYTGDRPVPLLFEFHAYGSQSIEQLIYGDFRAIADRDGFVIVAPDGRGRPRHFNVFEVPTEADDLQFTRDLLEHLANTLCIDRTRVYSAGMSDGGAMTSLLACKASDRFAAFGAVALVAYDAARCGAGGKVPIMAFNGTADPVVPFNGGRVNCCGTPQIPPVNESMDGWARHDGCDVPPVDTAISPQVQQRRWNGCDEGTEVVQYVVQGGGHTWPGAAINLTQYGLTTKDVNASNLLWEFFGRHRS